MAPRLGGAAQGHCRGETAQSRQRLPSREVTGRNWPTSSPLSVPYPLSRTHPLGGQHSHPELCQAKRWADSVIAHARSPSHTLQTPPPLGSPSHHRKLWGTSGHEPSRHSNSCAPSHCPLSVLASPATWPSALLQPQRARRSRQGRAQSQGTGANRHPTLLCWAWLPLGLSTTTARGQVVLPTGPFH